MLLVPDKRAVVLTLRNPERVVALIPKYQRLNDNHIAVRHGIEEVRVLRNLGIDAPSPILSNYDWPGKYVPFAHQKATSSFFTLNPRCFCFNEMGLGKSLSALWSSDFLMNEGILRKVLVITTMSCMETVWQHELFNNLMHRTSIVVHGTKHTRLLAIKENVDYYIINHDGLRVPGVVDALLARGDIDLIVVDEASMFRNSRTKTYASFRKLLKPHHQLWMLTGQPCPNGPEDAFGLGHLVSPSRLPQYFTRWQAETMVKVSQFKWRAKPGAMAKVYDALQPAIRYTKEECLDLPPVVYLNRSAPLSLEQQRAYKLMKDKLRMAAASGESITAVNAAVKLSKLLQICCGCVNTDLNGHAPLDATPRLSVIKEIIDESIAKVIVFVPYTGALNQVARYLEDEGYSIGVVDGHVTGNKRTAILNAFTRGNEMKVLVANPDTASHGLNLSVASTMIWFSPVHSLDTYKQACERMARPGQANHMQIVHIGSTPLEWKVYQTLAQKGIDHESLLSLYKEEMEHWELF